MSRLDATVVPPPRAGAFETGARAPDPVAPEAQEANRSYGYDRLFFRRLWQLSRPYWTRPGALGSWLVLGFLLVTVVAYSACGAWIAWLTKSQTDALMNHHADAFWKLLVAVGGLTFLRAGISALQTVVDGALDLHWHQWMAQHLLVRYFSRRHYYKLVLDERLENTDQRLQEELSPFCTMMSSFPRLGLGTLVDALVQLGVLLSISGRLFWVIGLFSLVKFGLLVWVYTPVIRQNYNVTEAEGHYRASIRHVMVNAETVAFYRGEGPERRRITGHLQSAVRHRLARTLYATRINLLQGGLSTVWLVLPLLVLAPQFFGGEIKYGTIAESVAAVALLLQSLSLFMQFIPTISLVSHKVARLGEVNELFDRIDAAGMDAVDSGTGPGPGPASGRADALIAQRTGEVVRLEDVSLSTPGGEHRLVQGLNLVVPPGERWLVSGPTGVGKSSLLRAMAGLWTRGQGRLTMPPPDEVMFLPQRPYLIPGSLREQLYYPNLVGEDSDFVLQGVLAAACLPQLTAQYGGFDTVQDWARVLSLGEQQRLAVARVLLAQPRYLFLDEATSAVDLDTERRLYLALAATGVTYVSVGHRPSLTAFHDAELRLLEDGGWSTRPLAPPAPAAAASP